MDTIKSAATLDEMKGFEKRECFLRGASSYRLNDLHREKSQRS